MLEITTSSTDSFEARWNDKHSRAARDGGFWHPIAGSPNFFKPLGSVGVTHYNDINRSHWALLVGPSGHPSNGPPSVKSPVGYTQIWNGQQSGSKKDGSFWCPIPPPGYVALGDVVGSDWTTPPSTDDVYKGSLYTADVSVWEILREYHTNPPDPENPATFVGSIRASNNYDAPDLNLAGFPDKK
ncbi:vacuolar protein sorting-associated protein 62 [Trichoderma evansii]